MRVGKISDLVHSANVAGLEAQESATAKASRVQRAYYNSMTPADFVQHWQSAESKGNAAKIQMLTDLFVFADPDFQRAVEKEFAK
jgi:hypothetical protein